MHQTTLFQKLGLFLSAFSLMSTALMATDAPVVSPTENTSVILPTITVPEQEISAEESDIIIDYPKYVTNQLLLPRKLYILPGSSSYSDSFNIYYRNVFSTLKDTYNLGAFCSFGQVESGRWIAKTSAPTLPSEPFKLSFTANTGEDILLKSTDVEFVDPTNMAPVRLLAIGDSLTRAGVYLSEVQSRLPNTKVLGTRFYPEDHLPAREGRGGWSLEDYFTFPNVQGLDSPFMFPEGVSGEHYKGNTSDWKNICYNNPTSPVYNGFQKLARGWQDAGEFLYDANGYYKYPAVGDVMYNPELPSYNRFIEWDGERWMPMTNQPAQCTFDFSKYMARHFAAFNGEKPTHVSILLGANEFGLNKQLDQMDTYIERLNTMIDSIHAYDPEIKVILCTPTLGPNTDRITSEEKKHIYTEYNLCMKYTVTRLLEAFDTDEALARHIYIAPMTLTVDPNTGFTYVTREEMVNGVNTTVTDVQNSIHPNNSYGQLQMGDTLAAVIQKTR